MQAILLEGREVVPNKVVCVGKNYVAHIREMGGSESAAEPTIFMKPNSAIAPRSDRVTIPREFGLLHHEVELCFTVSGRCKNLGHNEAMEVISGWGIGIDFTLREKQRAAKGAGLPWTISKCFDSAAVFGEFIQPSAPFDPLDLSMTLAVNGETRQSTSTKLMIFRPIPVLCYVSKFMTIEPGDVFMLGTPKGVGEVVDGDCIDAQISSLPSLRFTVERP